MWADCYFVAGLTSSGRKLVMHTGKEKFWQKKTVLIAAMARSGKRKCVTTYGTDLYFQNPI